MTAFEWKTFFVWRVTYICVHVTQAQFLPTSSKHVSPGMRFLGLGIGGLSHQSCMSLHIGTNNIVGGSIIIEVTINEINHYIDTVNHSQNMSTPMCHSAIRHRRGKKGGRKYMKNIYRKLKDGVHGTKETRKLWAAAIEGAIRNNRNTKDDPLSPKRAWRRERRTPLNF